MRKYRSLRKRPRLKKAIAMYCFESPGGVLNPPTAGLLQQVKLNKKPALRFHESTLSLVVISAAEFRDAILVQRFFKTLEPNQPYCYFGSGHIDTILSKDIRFFRAIEIY